MAATASSDKRSGRTVFPVSSAGRFQQIGMQADAVGPKDGEADEQDGPDTLPTSPDKPEEPLDDAPPMSVSGGLGLRAPLAPDGPLRRSAITPAPRRMTGLRAPRARHR